INKLKRLYYNSSNHCLFKLYLIAYLIGTNCLKHHLKIYSLTFSVFFQSLLKSILNKLKQSILITKKINCLLKSINYQSHT
ncbi:hypothetical protein BpHYR1_006811, partial [Brachionus plicatilis]